MYLHTFAKLMWVDLPEGKDRVTRTTKDDKEWINLTGINATRCDITQTGTVWAIDHNGTVHYYQDLLWKSLDKKADDIGCGGAWLPCIAAICNGHLERFEGTHWTNMGGTALKALDISNKEDVIVTLDEQGNTSLFDKMGMVHLKLDHRYQDVSCGRNGAQEILVLSSKQH